MELVVALETHQESSSIHYKAQHPRYPSAVAGVVHHSAHGTLASGVPWLPSYLEADSCLLCWALLFPLLGLCFQKLTLSPGFQYYLYSYDTQTIMAQTSPT